MKRVLTIAGSDSGGGAGIQADLKTFISLGCYGTSAITAVTAQNTIGVYSVFSLKPEFVANQIRVVLEDIGADIIKIGMLFDSGIIHAVSEVLKDFSEIPIVLDPIMMSQRGYPLLESEAIEALKTKLLPQVYLLTPTLEEARFLAGDLDIADSASKILSMGPKSVLVRAGFLNPKLFFRARDYLLCAGEKEGTYFGNNWVNTKNTHGSGCTFSAALAAYLAKGFDLPKAVLKASTYLTEILSTGINQKIGFGIGPVIHQI